MCFVNNNYFEIVETVHMGLGIRMTEFCSFYELGEALVGVLEPISFAFFNRLHGDGYQSLYEFVDDQEETIFSVLFGPLCLCNSQFDAPVGFGNVL